VRDKDEKMKWKKVAIFFKNESTEFYNKDFDESTSFVFF
jgi:hypothetical protein